MQELRIIFLQVNEANLDNVTHEEAVAALKATQEVVNLTIAKPSYVPDNVSQEPATPPCKFVMEGKAFTELYDCLKLVNIAYHNPVSLFTGIINVGSIANTANYK